MLSSNMPFQELVRLDAERRGVASNPATPLIDEEDDDDDGEIAVAVNSGRRRCKRHGGPVELTPAMHALIELLLRGVEPFAAAKSCRFQRRALRHLLKSRAFRDAYERDRTARHSERAPTIEQLERTAPPRDPERASAPAAPAQAGYAIRLKLPDPEPTA